MSRASFVGLGVALITVLASGCRDAPPTATAEPSPAPSAPLARAASASSGRPSALHLGAPIEEGAPTVALADLAKNPGAWSGKSFATEGTVTAVCQHMGCWMELRSDDGNASGSGAATDAHVKMAGHHFFVPRTAAGHKARVLATLEAVDPAGAGAATSSGACSEEGSAASGGGGGDTPGSCRAEAEGQLGHPLSKLELVADGVELM